MENEKEKTNQVNDQVEALEGVLVAGDEGGLTPEERKTIIDKLCDLFTMRSAIALIVCVAFCYMTFKGEVGVEDLKTIFMMILTWYFAADTTKKADNG